MTKQFVYDNLACLTEEDQDRVDPLILELPDRVKFDDIVGLGINLAEMYFFYCESVLEAGRIYALVLEVIQHWMGKRVNRAEHPVMWESLEVLLRHAKGGADDAELFGQMKKIGHRYTYRYVMSEVSIPLHALMLIAVDLGVIENPRSEDKMSFALMVAAKSRALPPHLYLGDIINMEMRDDPSAMVDILRRAVAKADMAKHN